MLCPPHRGRRRSRRCRRRPACPSARPCRRDPTNQHTRVTTRGAAVCLQPQHSQTAGQARVRNTCWRQGRRLRTQEAGSCGRSLLHQEGPGLGGNRRAAPPLRCRRWTSRLAQGVTMCVCGLGYGAATVPTSTARRSWVWGLCLALVVPNCSWRAGHASAGVRGQPMKQMAVPEVPRCTPKGPHDSVVSSSRSRARSRAIAEA